MSDLDLPVLWAYSYGPVFSLPAHIRVIHSTEGPMSRGNARALAGPSWFGGPAAGTSAHDIFDPGEGIKMVPDNHLAWHVGSGGNGFTRGSEHCGRVALTTEQWLSADGREMLERSARYNAAAGHRDGVLPRWLTLTQLARKEPGFCTHNDIRLVFGGTTHSDPGPNFPYAWYMDRVRAHYYGEEPDDMPGYREWEAADKKALVTDVTSAVIRAVTRGEMPDGNFPPHLVTASTGHIVDLVELLRVGDNPDPAAGETHPGNLATINEKLDQLLAAHVPPTGG